MRTEKRQRTVTYEVYVSSDGKVFESEDKCRHHEMVLNGSRKECPECHGSGRINGHYERYFDGGSMGDHQYHERWESDECPECKGKGYLEKVTEWR